MADEDNWLNERANPQGLMWHLHGTSATRTKSGRRKLRLFACGCCRLFWDFLPDDRLRQAIDVAERFAEGSATKHELESARASVQPLAYNGSLAGRTRPARESAAVSMVKELTRAEPFAAAFAMSCYDLPLAGYCGDGPTANRIICDFLRDVFGNPFRPVAFSPEWRTDTAVAIARQMSESRDFGAMPILADALQDAECDSDDILAHCRDPQQVHVRGCWVVDLVLGRA